jgi:acyl carrier protein
MTDVDLRTQDRYQKLAEQIREKTIVNDAEILPGPEQSGITAIIVRQGYRPGPVFRDLVMRLAGEDHEDIRVAIVRQIPRRADGTVDLAAALALLDERALVLRYVAPATNVERILVDLIKQVLPQVNVSMSDDLIGLGGDSLVAVQLAELIAEQWGVEINGRDLFGAETIGDMAAVIARAVSPT